MIGRLLETGLLTGVLLSSCSGSVAETAGAPKAAVGSKARLAPTAAVSEHAWESRPVEGLGVRSRLWDVAVNEAGVFVAVGTVAAGEYPGEEALVVWRSEDGLSWEEVFRRHDVLEPGDGSGIAPSNAVVAHGLEFAFVGGDCPQRCHPVALYSPDGTSWREVKVPVRLPPPTESAAGRNGGGAVPGRRLILGSPEYTLSGAAMVDVAVLGDRLVAVGWAEGGNGKYSTSHVAWVSDDGGRRWRQVPEGAFGDGDGGAGRDELNRIVPAGDRVVAGGGNRCCYDQSVSGLWVSEDGEAWRAVTLPDAQSVNIDAMGVHDSVVHVISRPAFGEGEEPVQWRLSGNDGWERLQGPPGYGALLGEPGGLALVQSDWPPEGSPGRISLFRSPDGHDFRLSKATSPTAGLTVDTALVVGDRLLVYARSDGANRLFESRAGDN